MKTVELLSGWLNGTGGWDKPLERGSHSIIRSFRHFMDFAERGYLLPIWRDDIWIKDDDYTLNWPNKLPILLWQRDPTKLSLVNRRVFLIDWTLSNPIKGKRLEYLFAARIITRRWQNGP